MNVSDNLVFGGIYMSRFGNKVLGTEHSSKAHKSEQYQKKSCHTLQWKTILSDIVMSSRQPDIGRFQLQYIGMAHWLAKSLKTEKFNWICQCSLIWISVLFQ